MVQQVIEEPKTTDRMMARSSFWQSIKEIKINEYQNLLQIEKEVVGVVPRGD